MMRSAAANGKRKHSIKFHGRAGAGTKPPESQAQILDGDSRLYIWISWIRKGKKMVAGGVLSNVGRGDEPTYQRERTNERVK